MSRITQCHGPLLEQMCFSWTIEERWIPECIRVQQAKTCYTTVLRENCVRLWVQSVWQPPSDPAFNGPIADGNNKLAWGEHATEKWLHKSHYRSDSLSDTEVLQFYRNTQILKNPGVSRSGSRTSTKKSLVDANEMHQLHFPNRETLACSPSLFQVDRGRVYECGSDWPQTDRLIFIRNMKLLMCSHFCPPCHPPTSYNKVTFLRKPQCFVVHYPFLTPSLPSSSRCLLFSLVFFRAHLWAVKAALYCAEACENGPVV